jgi:hypothetical protein
MDAISSITYVDPSLEDMNLFDVNRNLNAIHGDVSGTLKTNADLDQILATDHIPRTVSRDPSDRVWNAQDQEENIRLLHRNCTLTDFPFPPVVAPPTNGKTSSDWPPPGDSCPPPPKRRRRKRKAQLTEAEKEDKHRRFLERNRLAASKCRTKKKNDQDRLEEKRKTLEQENLVLRELLPYLWDEVRLYRKAITAYASCDHPGIVELVERNSEFPAATDALCQSLLGDEEGKGSLDDGGSPRSSSDSLLRTSTSCLIDSPLTSSPPFNSPADKVASRGCS